MSRFIASPFQVSHPRPTEATVVHGDLSQCISGRGLKNSFSCVAKRAKWGNIPIRLACMGSGMPFQIEGIVESFPTKCAEVSLQVGMAFGVAVQ